MVVIMYLIIVYDIKVDRVNKIKSFLRQYLYWIQNSVFEGEVSKSEFKIIKDGLKEIIEEDEDSIILFNFKMEKMMNRDVMGIEKAPIDEIL